jgi:hypothetical protein
MLTDVYTVLSKLRSSEPLDANEQRVYEDGLVAILREIHDELDSAVIAAYGWPSSLTTEEILQRVVDLNTQRSSEEQLGTIRWLRPSYQQPAAFPVQVGLGLPEDRDVHTTVKIKKKAWPENLADQVRVVKDALRANEMLSSDTIAKRFIRARKTRVEEILKTLTALGQLREIHGKYVL